MERREFLKGSTLVAAAIGFPTIVPATVLGQNAPSNRIHVGMIGTGRQGFGQNLQGAAGVENVPGMLDIADAQVVAVCDVDTWRLERVRSLVDSRYGARSQRGSYKACKVYQDFREALADKDVDAVMISTPDHWHVPMAIMAAKAKKHISCEKPMSLSVQQGRRLVETVKESGVINRNDSEFRSMRLHSRGVELVRNGRIGRLERIEIVFPLDPPPVPVQVDMPVPKELDYEMWLGPAARVPYTDMRVHTPYDHVKRPNWMRVDTYAQGMIANWGAHYFDMAQWANDTERTGPVEVAGKGEFPKSLWNTMINFEVSYRYANGVEMMCKQTPDSKPSMKYLGSKGWILVTGYNGEITASDPRVLAPREPGELNFSSELSDKADFIAGIKQNKPTFEPLETGHRNITISQIGLIACQLEQKLKWNPDTELFEGNNQANALLVEPLYRRPWDALIS
jgi:myo-inositol 2-dehydrogenase/D-chiro-inositol 1-dehydrogenase